MSTRRPGMNPQHGMTAEEVRRFVADCGPTVVQVRYAAELENLLREMEWCISEDQGYGPLRCPWCDRSEWNYDESKGGHRPDCRLALLLGLPTSPDPCNFAIVLRPGEYSHFCDLPMGHSGVHREGGTTWP